MRRSREVNVLLRMSMLAGLEMELDSTLNLICDLAAEIVSFSRGAVYFWEEDGEGMHLRVTRNHARSRGRELCPRQRAQLLGRQTGPPLAAHRATASRRPTPCCTP